jgi:hypothetical protein
MLRILRIALLFVLTFLGVNYPWTHAAIASLGNGMSRCPEVLTSQAKAQVEAFLGATNSSPWIVCQREPTIGLTVSHGTARFAPLLPSLIVIGPFGANTDVIAHEWMHAEIAARTSALLRTYRIPTWFDEGLSMQLDHRADYGDDALKIYNKAGLLSGATLSQLSTPSQFFHTGDRGKAHYAIAKCAVGRWLQATAHQSRLAKLLQSVSWWGEFPTQQFDEHAQTCIRQSS